MATSKPLGYYFLLFFNLKSKKPNPTKTNIIKPYIRICDKTSPKNI